MKRIKPVLFAIFSCLLWQMVFPQTPFKSGNLVVTRIGNGSIAFTGRSFPVFLDEYTPAGTLVQSIPLPTVTSGSNNRLLLTCDDYGLGTLTLSPDNRYLALAGYDVAVNTSGSIVKDGSITRRTNALIDYNGVINTSTALTGLSGYYPYCLVTSNGNDMWGGYTDDGIRYSQSGNTTSTLVNPDASVMRIFIRNGQLLVSTSTGAILTVGTGLPTNEPTNLTALPGIPLLLNKIEFVFADMDPGTPGDDVLYLVCPAVGIQKYSLVGSTWTLNGTIGTSTEVYGSITGVINGTTATLYCVRKVSAAGDNPNGSGEIVTLTDNTGYSTLSNSFVGTPTIIVPDIAGSNKAFRGIAMAPTPPTVSVSVKAFLQSAYSIGLGRHKDVTTVWRDVLNANALSQPFNVAPFNYAGTESVAPGFFQSNAAPANTDILDWILLELHDATTPSTIVARKACFIREDGQVVDLDGNANPTFTGVGANNYYIVLKHRNHLTIRSSSTVFVNGAAPTLYDFTSAQSQAYQNGAIVTNPAMKDLTGGGTVFGMFGGNANSNSSTRASGALSINDYLYLVNILLGGNTATILPNTYNSGDLNLDGQVRASGALTINDYLILVNTILGGNTANIYTEHQ
jgi:hypothetical protein